MATDEVDLPTSDGGILALAYPKLELSGYEVSVLFLMFVGITVSWEALLGVLTFVNNLVRGKRASWLHRVKDEVLALGVVSLVLLFLQVRAGQWQGQGSERKANSHSCLARLPTEPAQQRAIIRFYMRRKECAAATA